MERSKIIDKAEETLNTGIIESEKRILKDLIKLLQDFDKSGGRLVFNADTIKLINQAEFDILNALNKSGYNSRVKQYLKDFDKIKQASILQQKSVNKIDVSVRLLNNIQKGAIQQTTNALLGNGLNTALIQPVKNILMESATSGMTIPQAELQLRQVILGDSEKLGKLERYATQISRDAISQYDGMMQSRIAKEYELDGISYEGSLIKDSRPQCVRWATMGEIPAEDLEGEIAWAYKNGSGMIPNTEPANFVIYRGGFNCRHTATAIRLENEPNQKLTRLLNKAKEAEDEMQQITESVTNKFDASATDILFKSRGSAIRKAITEYDRDYEKITDLIRNTVFTDKRNELTKIIAQIKEESKAVDVTIQKVKTRNHASDELGYSGNLIIGRTKNGTTFETQVNTSKMIYAKEKPEDAIRILGQAKWNEIKRETGLPGGLGHKYYEQYRKLNPNSRDAIGIQALSREYYSHFLD